MVILSKDMLPLAQQNHKTAAALDTITAKIAIQFA
jgi:hypothetical protein